MLAHTWWKFNFGVLLVEFDQILQGAQLRIIKQPKISLEHEAELMP